MITLTKLHDLGFKTINDPFSGKKVFAVGEKDLKTGKLPIVYYNLLAQTCTMFREDFCIITRVCKTEQEIIQFVEAINFLFGTKIVVKKLKK